MRLQRKLFLDTSFVVANLNPRDEHHKKSIDIFQETEKQNCEIWTHEGIILEIGNAFSKFKRAEGFLYLSEIYQTERINLITLENGLIEQGLALFGKMRDKSWGLVDCISFVIMKQFKISQALTADIHFQQAGFTALLRKNF